MAGKGLLCLGAASKDPITICGGVKEGEKVEKDHAWIPDLINGGVMTDCSADD